MTIDCSDFTDKSSHEWCHGIYNKYVYDAVRKGCKTHLTRRPKRLEPITLILGLITLAGTLSITNNGLVATSLVKISKLRSDMEDRLNGILDIEEKLNNEVTKIRETLNNFTGTTLPKREKVYFNGMEFTAVSVTAGKTIESIFDEWKHNRITDELLRFGNISDVMEKMNCPATQMRPLSCMWFEEEKILEVEFYGRVISTEERILEADPFILYHGREGMQCKTVYSGPSFIYLSSNINASCPVHPVKKQDIYLSATNKECKNNTLKTWKTNCFDEVEPVDNIVQVKSVNYGMYVYCKGSDITIFSTKQQCPSTVFIIPANTSFSLNGHEYEAKQHTISMATPEFLTLYQHQVNTFISKNNNPYEISTNHDIEKQIHLERQKNTTTSVLTFMTGLLVSLLVLVMFLLVKYSCSKHTTSEDERLSDRTSRTHSLIPVIVDES